MIALQQLEEHIGTPAEEWAGACYGIACKAAELVDGARPVYGHFLGAVHPKSVFAAASRAGFVQHGWVVLPDGKVIDPTRWVFECKKPYIYIGPAGVDYDEGGNQFRTASIGSPPRFDPDEKTINISSSMLPTEAWNFIESTLGLQDMFMEDGYEPGDVNVKQLGWVANLDPRLMQGQASVIYGLLERLHMAGFIPYDNRVMVKEGRVT